MGKTMPVKSSSGKRAGAVPDRARMGERLREIRKRRRLTLKALSERSGVALSTLSKIELGQISVSYEKLAAAARALEVDIALLFDARAAALPGAGDRGPVVVRSTLDAAPGYDGQNYDYRMLATDFPGKRMTPLHGTIVARAPSQFPDFVRHPGQEFVMVLAGSVRIHFETGEAIELKRHESAYFDSGVGHIYLSTGKADAQVLVVMAEG
jgi:transcriptional regulator with XRE-family HTH domain